MRSAVLRRHVAALLDWHNAHVTFDDAVAGMPPAIRGRRPRGLTYSPWELVEHLRLCQRDILDYCVRRDYEERQWPSEYWPAQASPPSATAWNRSVAGFRRDLRALKRIATNPRTNLLSNLPYGRKATYLRELLLVADHNAYHVGQLVVVRRLLGDWE